MKPRLLITGFGPFPGQPHNPSAPLVRGLRQIFARAQSGFDIRAVVLKTEYQAGLKKLNTEMRSYKPDIVICFGVAAGETGFRLEQQAQNRCSITHADASGHKPDEATILTGGQASHPSTLPLDKINNALVQSEIPCLLSDDAGDYLCNYIFYHLMAQTVSDNRPVRAGFIHIPMPDHPGTLSRQQLVRGARAIINAAADYAI